MLTTEYLIILVPVFLAILIIFYFIYHLWHSEKYSEQVLKNIVEKIAEIERSELQVNGRLIWLITEFKLVSNEKKRHLFDIERRIGIDMASFYNKLDKVLKKK